MMVDRNCPACAASYDARYPRCPSCFKPKEWLRPALRRLRITGVGTPDLLDVRVGRLCLHVAWSWPFVRFGWNSIPTLLTSFGWWFFWVRGLGVLISRKS